MVWVIRALSHELVVILWNAAVTMVMVAMVVVIVTMVKLNILAGLVLDTMMGSQVGPMTQGTSEAAAQLMVFVDLKADPRTAPLAPYEAVKTVKLVRFQVRLSGREVAVRVLALELEVHDIDGLLGDQVADPIKMNNNFL